MEQQELDLLDKELRKLESKKAHRHDFEPKESDGFVEVCSCGRERISQIPFD